MSKWISVKDRLPEKSGYYLAIMRECHYVDGFRCQDRCAVTRWKEYDADKDSTYEFRDPTGFYLPTSNVPHKYTVLYWMNIPEFPEWLEGDNEK